MTTHATSPVLRDVLSLYRGESVAGLADEGLLRRFVEAVDRGEPEVADTAFTAVMDRHGPMVLGVCRRALDDPNDVDDAFQATFLVLVRKARSVRVEGSLGRWLYGVARKVAARARIEASRRRARLASEETPAPERVGDSDGFEVRAAIDEELARLPERYRAPIVLCALDGLSYEEAAGRLRWPVGTLKSRLSRGRDRLAERLTRRGVAPAAAMTSIGRLCPAVPAALSAATLDSARRLALGGVVAPGLLRLAARALPSGAAAKAGTLVTLALGIVGAGLLDVRAQDAALKGQAKIDGPAVAGIKAEDLKPAPGCVWEQKPHPLTPGDGSWGQGGRDGTFVYDYHFDARTGFVKLVLIKAHKIDRDDHDFRPVIFDAKGGRHELTSGGGVGMGGDVFVGVSSYMLETTTLPAPVAFLAIERITPAFHRIQSEKARKEAKAAGLAILPPPRVGEKFQFDVVGSDGKPIRSADLRGKVVIVHTWQPPWDGQLIQKFRTDHPDGDLAIVGVGFVNSRDNTMQPVLQQNGVDWPQVIVPSDDARISRLWREGSEIPGNSQFLLIDRAGILRAVGRLEELEAKVGLLLREPAAGER